MKNTNVFFHCTNISITVSHLKECKGLEGDYNNPITTYNIKHIIISGDKVFFIVVQILCHPND